MSDKIMHAPKPGPMYWDGMCLKCDGLVSDHANIFQRIRYYADRWVIGVLLLTLARVAGLIGFLLFLIAAVTTESPFWAIFSVISGIVYVLSSYIFFKLLDKERTQK